MANLQERIHQLQAEIDDLKRRFPAHSRNQLCFNSWKTWKKNWNNCSVSNRRNNSILAISQVHVNS